MMPHRALVHARRAATALVGIAAVAGLGGCAAQLGSMAPGAEVLEPNNAFLSPPPLDRGTFDVSVFKGGAAAAQHPYDQVVMREAPDPSDSALAVVVREWGPPVGQRDSMIVNRRTLEPVDEVYFAHGVRYAYTFDGTSVHGTITPAHGSVRHVAKSYAEPVFALNEVGSLVRALDYQVGMTEVVPLFSEVRRTLQHDTLSVLRQETKSGHAPEYIVRFSTPQLTTDYAVNATSRRILNAVTTIRRTGVETRYEYPGATG